MEHLLSILVWLPFIGSAALLASHKSSEKVARGIAWAISLLTLGLALLLVAKFDGGTFHFQFKERYAWIPSLGIRYMLGIDGISLWLVVLTAFLGVFAVAMSRYVTKQIHTYMALLLALETFMLGAFCSLDLILFFTFFELTLFPMYFLITGWGGERRNFAAAKFFIYTFAGSIFMLIGMIVLATRVSGGPTFDILEIQRAAASGQLWSGSIDTELYVFWAFAVALLIKAPAFPFHTWMPVTYTDSPTVVPVLSSVMVKLGTFGLLRFCLPLFPDVVGSQAPILMTLAVIGIVYGGIVAAIQPDMRRLVAYSSISHMGFILLGIASLTHEGLVGAAYQQINHGVIAAGLLILLAFLYERRKTRLLSEYGGLKSQMPVFAALFLILMLASLGLPGTSGFIGEFLSLLGAFEASMHHLFGISVVFPVVAGFGVVLSAVYLLYMFQRIFYGPVSNPENSRLRDLKSWEMGLVGMLIAVVIWGGLYPSTFLKPMEASLQATRLMAINPSGARPQWLEPTQEIGTGNDEGVLTMGSKVISPAELHYTLPREESNSKAKRGGAR